MIRTAPRPGASRPLRSSAFGHPVLSAFAACGPLPIFIEEARTAHLRMRRYGTRRLPLIRRMRLTQSSAWHAQADKPPNANRSADARPPAEEYYLPPFYPLDERKLGSGATRKLRQADDGGSRNPHAYVPEQGTGASYEQERKGPWEMEGPGHPRRRQEAPARGRLHSPSGARHIQFWPSSA